MPAESALRAAFDRYVCQTSDAPLGIEVERAAGATLWDRSGRSYLDLLAGMGVANIGHGRAEVLAAIGEQSARHLHVAVYGEAVQQAQVALAERLAALTPGDLEVTFFTNSGAEAVEGALKAARKFTGRREIVCFDGAYHGDTFGALSVCGNPTYREPFEPLLPEIVRLPWNEIDALERIGERTAAVIVEPVQAEGGVRIPSEDFLPALRRQCDRAGALLIADEVLTGFGRTGRWFACEHWRVTPDVMVLAKALGGGLPLGAFIGRRQVMATLSHEPPLAHVTTFGGHPLSCAAGLAAIGVLERDDLVRRAAEVGSAWREQLRRLDHPSIRQVRGLGMLFAIEFDRPAAAQAFAVGCLARGVILNWTLHRDTVIRFAPPLTLSDDEIAHATAVMRAALG